MRVFASMLWWLSSGIIALILLQLAVASAFADTGTYRVSDYIVTLEPQSDGQVMITVEQQWQVLSGNIPWVTVGLPNSNFSITSHSGAASKVSTANGNGFSGVRVDLDRDYQPGQNFTIKFTVSQRNLLERLTSDKKWRIDYTPGWYDRASIDHLQINLISPVDYQTYTSVSPKPTSVNNNVITWERLNLSPGDQLNVILESTDGRFLSESIPAGTSQGDGLGKAFYVTAAIIIVAGLLIFLVIRKNRQDRDTQMREQVLSIEKKMAVNKETKKKIEEGFQDYVAKKNIQPDAQGRYYDSGLGDYITPALWAGVIRQQSYNTRSGFQTGCVSTCACACVSCACACACACAGGGAAGCSRKSFHECRTCSVLSGKIYGANSSGNPQSLHVIKVKEL